MMKLLNVLNVWLINFPETIPKHSREYNLLLLWFELADPLVKKFQLKEKLANVFSLFLFYSVPFSSIYLFYCFYG